MTTPGTGCELHAQISEKESDTPHATLGHQDQAERLATRLAVPGTFVQPFALRALAVIRRDRVLLDQATARFNDLDLEWHAKQTRLDP